MTTRYCSSSASSRMAHAPHSLSFCHKHCLCAWTSSGDSDRRNHRNSIACVLKFRPIAVRLRCLPIKELRTSLLKSWNQLSSLPKQWDFEDYLSLISYQFTMFSFAGAVVLYLSFTQPSIAVDALKTCTCLLKECRLELAKCIANPSCAANIACLQTCNDRPDETECQIKCGDLFENPVVDEFNSCAISQNKCVPQKSDIGEFPVPNPESLVKSFNISDFTGKWYITSGLNQSFDTFDCQLHEFHTESNKLVGNITWRVKTPDDSFFTRSTTQTFVQDPENPGILYNHNNEYLHYEDDWYIVSSKINHEEDDYIFVYYRGRNDAWDGYGGAVVYTRKTVLPKSIVPELEAAARSVGRDFSSFVRTNNECEREAPLVDRIEKIVEKEVEEIEESVAKVGEKEVQLFKGLGKGLKELQKDEDYFFRSLSKEEMELFENLKMEAVEVEKLFGGTLPLRKLR